MRCGVAVSPMAQIGQSEAIHSPDAWASTVVRLTRPAAWSIAVVCTVANLVLAQGLTHDLKAARQRRIAEVPCAALTVRPVDRAGERLFGIGKVDLGFGQS